MGRMRRGSRRKCRFARIRRPPTKARETSGKGRDDARIERRMEEARARESWSARHRRMWMIRFGGYGSGGSRAFDCGVSCLGDGLCMGTW